MLTWFQNMRLRDKGMILVISLLSLELFFISILGNLLSETEKELNENFRAKRILECSGKLQTCLSQAGIAMAEYAATHSETFGRQYDEQLSRVQSQLKILDSLMQSKSEREEYLEIRKSIDVTVNLLNTAKQIADQRSDELNLPTILIRVRGQISKFQESMKEVSKEYEYAEFMPAQNSVNSSYGRLKLVLLLGLILNIILAVVLMWSFLGTITRRLEILVDNTVLFSKRKTLNEPLAGKDELASLDQSFHKMADSLEEAERVKRQLASMLTHDLRSPLSSIQWTLALLSAGAYGELSEDGIDRVTSAEKGCDDLISLINDLLDLDKVQSGKLSLNKEEIDLSQTIDDSLAELKGLADRMNINLEKSSNGSLPYNGDGKRLRQLVVNLVANAIKFSPAKSVVQVEVSTIEDAYELRVKDRGKGIAKADQERLFERFETGSTQQSEIRGTGLGLAIARAIVEAHGGTIGVTSEEGSGSTFWARLPLH